MPIAINQEGPLNVKRTLGSLVPHPANIGKIAGAHLGITAPRMHLARGGVQPNNDVLASMFQPVGITSQIPDAGIDYISSPQLRTGSGPPAPPSSAPEKQPDSMQQIAEGTTAAIGLTDAYKGINKGIGGLLSDTGNNPSLLGSIKSGLSGNGFGGILSGPNAQSANWLAGTNSFAPGVSLDTLAGNAAPAAAAALPAATDLGATIAASAAPAAIADAGATTALAALAPTTASSFLPAWLTAAFELLADGGAVNGYADGGPTHGFRIPPQDTFHPSGLLNSAGPGRTDTINTSVPTGAYVIPADVVSGLGEGNTLAGSAVIDRMFSTAPYGIKERNIPRGKGAGHIAAPEPRNPDSGPSTVDTQFINSAGMYAKGGKTEDKAPVVVAGGEHVISPQQIIAKFGSLKRGHKILDHWILAMREKHVKELKKLAPPVGSRVKK